MIVEQDGKNVYVEKLSGEWIIEGGRLVLSAKEIRQLRTALLFQVPDVEVEPEDG